MQSSPKTNKNHNQPTFLHLASEKDAAAAEEIKSLRREIARLASEHEQSLEETKEEFRSIIYGIIDEYDKFKTALRPVLQEHDELKPEVEQLRKECAEKDREIDEIEMEKRSMDLECKILRRWILNSVQKADAAAIAPSWKTSLSKSM